MRRILLSVLLVLSSACSSSNNGDEGGSSGTGGGFQLGKTAILVVTPDPISFGSVAVNDTATVEVMLTNGSSPDDKSAGNLELKTVKLGNEGGDLSVTQPAVKTLPPGASTTVNVVYTPTDSLPDYNTLVVDFHNSSKPTVVSITTLEQIGKLRINPSPVEFGAVNGGETKTISTRIFNDGSDDIQVGSFAISTDSSADFAISAAYASSEGQCNGLANSTEQPFPFKLAPGGNAACVDISYTPFGGGPDIGNLQIFAPYDPQNPTEALAVALLQGVEVGPELTIANAETKEEDNTLNFGGVSLKTEKVMSFLLVNDGTRPLTIESVTKGVQESEAFEAIELITQVPAGTVIPPKDEGDNTYEVQVKFAPQKTYPVVYGPLGFLNILSDDGDEAQSFVTVFGQVASPKLKLTPPTVVDFGFVGPGGSNDRTFTITNEGGADLVVEFIKLGENTTGEFTIKDDKGLSNGGTIKAGDFMPLTLNFKHGGLSPGEVWSSIELATNDPNGTTKVSLKATRSDTLECKIELQPVTLNYGTVPYGFEKTMVMNVVNVGTGPCSWSHATLADIAFPELFPGVGGCTPGNGSSNFKIKSTPPGFKNGIKPGMSYPLEISYVPEANIFSQIFEEDFFSFGGLVQVHLLDFNKDPQNGAPVVVPANAGGGAFMACNLKGKSGVANIAAIPAELDLGLTTVGCYSKTQTVTIYNTGKAPLSICNIALDGCGPEFKLKNVPAIAPCQNNSGGLALVQGQPVKVDVVYAPQDLGKDGCTLTIKSTDPDTPAVAIPLLGSGTFDDEQTDIFTQGSGQEVDVLFVVDNSGSMGDEQKSLANNFGTFVNVAQSWNTDYQLGVITTDLEETNKMRGKLMGDPRYVKSDNVNSFQNSVEVGKNGSGSEQGLAAAQTALSLPLTLDPKPKQDCTNDAAVCKKPAECVPAADGSGKSYCGGWNMGFLRKDAALEIVFVSDEEDGSPAALDFYIDFFKSLKGFANDNMFHAHAIVGDKGNGCDGPGGKAVAGNRYLDVAQATGGKFHSICNSNWAQKLKDIGDTAFGLKVQFFLTRPAIANTIKVTVANKVCTNGWQYDEGSNSVIFEEAGNCMPKEGDKLEIYYKVICYSN